MALRTPTKELPKLPISNSVASYRYLMENVASTLFLSHKMQHVAMCVYVYECIYMRIAMSVYI